MRERVNKGLILLLAAGLMAAALCGCVRFESTVDPSVTMPQETTGVEAEPSPTPEPTAEPTAEPTPEEVQQIDIYDELGAFITGSDHYRRYISFENIQVYEQEEDTFVDMQAVNAIQRPYSARCICALQTKRERWLQSAGCKRRTGNICFRLSRAATRFMPRCLRICA